MTEPKPVSTRDTEIGKQRRTAILRLLADQEGREANFNVIMAFIHRSRFEATSRDRLNQDLDLLKQYGLIADEFLDGGMRIAKLTERGVDGAYGRLDDAIIDNAFWKA